MKFNKLSILIPLYNEEKTITKILEKIQKVNLSLKKEIIIVDDGSTDNSHNLVNQYIMKNKLNNIILIRKENNGKGSAIKESLKHATGEICIVQDADLEYDPDDYENCIKPILNNKSYVVYGSRRLNKENKKHSSFFFFLGGILVTWLTNLLFNAELTDEPTCYKVFRTDLIKNIKIDSNGFEWEPEITAKILKRRIPIIEVPIKYSPRSIKEGKKIKWKDGLIAIVTLLKYKFKS